VRVGYARVSRQDQKLEPQRDVLLADGCERVFEEKVPSRDADRQPLREAFGYCREGDVLVVARHDRLGRSLRAHRAGQNLTCLPTLRFRLRAMVANGYSTRMSCARSRGVGRTWQAGVLPHGC
jgi:DNA invertase Pin-like site-specific DNA recombinase